MSVWKIIKSNADNEREQHNRILADIRTVISNLSTGLLDLGSPADALGSDPLFDFGEPT